MIAVRYENDGQRLGLSGIGRGLRGSKRTRVGIELEARNVVAQEVCRVNEAAEGGLYGNGQGFRVGTVALIASGVNHLGGDAGGQIDGIGRHRGVKRVRDVDVLAARIDRDRTGLGARAVWAADEEVQLAGADYDITDELVGGVVSDIDEAAG